MLRKTSHWRYLACTYLALLCIPDISHSKGRNIPGLVHVKFQTGKLANLTLQIDTNDILIPQLRSFLQRYGFKGGRKIFRSAVKTLVDQIQDAGFKSVEW